MDLWWSICYDWGIAAYKTNLLRQDSVPACDTQIHPGMLVPRSYPKSKQHSWSTERDISIVRKSGEPRFKPGAAGWEARRQSLYFAAPTPLVMKM